MLIRVSSTTLISILSFSLAVRVISAAVHYQNSNDPAESTLLPCYLVTGLMARAVVSSSMKQRLPWSKSLMGGKQPGGSMFGFRD